MKDNTHRLSIGMVLAAVLAVELASAVWAAEQILLRGQDENVAVTNLEVKENGEISGVLANKSSRPVRDVQLLIRHGWRWKNEFRPQEDTLSRAIYHTVEKEIPAGGSGPFNYKPSEPLPSRPDGYFETTVSVAGFTEVIRPPQ